MIDFLKNFKPTKWWHYIVIGLIMLLLSLLTSSCLAVWDTTGKVQISTDTMHLPQQIPATAFIGALINAITGFSQAAMQQQYNLELMKQQHNYNVQDWNMQNEYNLPSNQMARYKDAGLNPNLIYSDGAANVSGSLNSVSQPSSPKVDLGKVDPLIFKQIELLDSQINKNNKEGNAAETNAETNAYNAETNAILAAAKAKNIKADTQQRLLTFEIQKATKEQQIEIINLRTDEERVALAEATYKFRNVLPEIAKQYQLKNQEIEKNIDYLVAKTGMTNAQAAKCYAECLVLAATKTKIDNENNLFKETSPYLVAHRAQVFLNEVAQGNLSEQELEQRSNYEYGLITSDNMYLAVPGLAKYERKTRNTEKYFGF